MFINLNCTSFRSVDTYVKMAGWAAYSWINRGREEEKKKVTEAQCVLLR